MVISNPPDFTRCEGSTLYRALILDLMPQIGIILSILQMRKRSSGCSYHRQSHTASERLRLNPVLSDLKALFSLQMVNGTSSVFIQHFNVTSEKYENGKEIIFNFLVEISAQQNIFFSHALVTRIWLERVTSTALHEGMETAIVGSCQGLSPARLSI